MSLRFFFLFNSFVDAVVQLLSCVWLFLAPWTAEGFLVLHYHLKFSQTHVHQVYDAIQPSHPLLPLPSIFPSIRVFSNESTLCIRWPKYWTFSFSFSISPSKDYSGLIYFRIDLFSLLAVQGTLKTLPQHHSLKASILQSSAFFMVQLPHLYMTTGKSHSLTIWIFFGKVISLLFNTLCGFVIYFLSKNKCLLISCLQSPFAVILESRKLKSVTACILLFFLPPPPPATI